MTGGEYRLGLAEGFSVTTELLSIIGGRRRFTPPIAGLAERMNVATRVCV
jgi:hypothetical protein